MYLRDAAAALLEVAVECGSGRGISLDLKERLPDIVENAIVRLELVRATQLDEGRHEVTLFVETDAAAKVVACVVLLLPASRCRRRRDRFNRWQQPRRHRRHDQSKDES